MTLPDHRILKFIKKHHVLTLSTLQGEQSWCCNCFYVFDDEKLEFYFLTDETTRHGSEMLINNKVSGSVVLESKIVGNLQGIQFSGIAYQQTGEELSHAKTKYLKRFPYAIAANSPCWTIRVDVIKFTDNTLGFGKKLLWNRETI